MALAPIVAPLFHKCRPYLIHLGYFRAGVVDVGEDHGGTAEDAVFQGYAFIDTDVVLDLATVADGDIGTDDDILADVAVFADFGAGKDAGEVPDFTPPANCYVVVNYCSRVHKYIGRGSR